MYVANCLNTYTHVTAAGYAYIVHICLGNIIIISFIKLKLYCGKFAKIYIIDRLSRKNNY